MLCLPLRNTGENGLENWKVLPTEPENELQTEVFDG